MKGTTEKSIDSLANIIDVVVWLLKDKPLLIALLSGNRAEAVSILVKDHKEEAVELIAKSKGTTVDEYEATSSYMIFNDLWEVLQGDELNAFFTSWRNQTKTSSGSAGKNTKAKKDTSPNGTKPSSKKKKKTE